MISPNREGWLTNADIARSINRLATNARIRHCPICEDDVHVVESGAIACCDRGHVFPLGQAVEASDLARLKAEEVSAVSGLVSFLSAESAAQALLWKEAEYREQRERDLLRRMNQATERDRREQIRKRREASRRSLGPTGARRRAAFVRAGAHFGACYEDHLVAVIDYRATLKKKLGELTSRAERITDRLGRP